MNSNAENAFDDSDMADQEDERAITMIDVLKEQEEFEENANAVLGASDDKNCTYLQGYIKRQALYACMTCNPDAKDDSFQRAGVCLACSLKCHEDHKLVELYTKRNFRCDCGNPKFRSQPCQFMPSKLHLNEENSYNQNFAGLYCICQRPYPDPKKTEEDEMIQCIICEDWLHSGHLDATVPDQYAEMVCNSCMQKNDFLHNYSELIVNSDADLVDSTLISMCNNDSLENVNVIDTTGDISIGNTEKLIEENINSESVLENVSLDQMDSTKNSMDIQVLTYEVELGNINQPEDISDSAMDQASQVNSSNVNNETVLNESKNLKTSEIAEMSTNLLDITDKKDNLSKNLQTEPGQKETEKYKEMTHEIKPLTEIPKVIDENNDTNSSIVQLDKTENPAFKSAEELLQMKEDKLLEDCEKHDDKVITQTVDEKIPTKTAFITKCNLSSSQDVAIESTNLKDPNNEEISKEKNDDAVKNNNINNIETHIDNNFAEISSKNERMCNEKNNISNNTKTTTFEVASNKIPENKRKLSIECQPTGLEPKKVKLHLKPCTKPNEITRKYKGATFWSVHFRQELCTCNECLSMYKDLSILFLIDPDDTVSAYENLGKEKTNGKTESEYEKGLAALSSLDRVQQINAITEYNKMKDKLLDFLKKFKDRKEVVKEEDIKAFFADIKPTREPDGVYFCR